ncbi:conserved membrane protein of unknown function [uncultured Woeseiaceae bacterium]|uniref:Uncharacterized protein n=1 Tax=uncultured Woeseiaceae bacterium TaxID=1983305 RepID=A0A7D9D2R9_9GAMM|nr:conserved membrane protein of unknown function [uncultured Woeseiaceae bacterium]
MITASQIVVLVLGVVVCALSAWGLMVPDKVWKLVNGALGKNWGIYVAVVARLLLGAALVIVAPESRFPMAFEILGWLAIVAAVVFLFAGRDRLRRFVAWIEQISQAVTRVWLLFGIAFGALLIYGIV